MSKITKNKVKGRRQKLAQALAGHQDFLAERYGREWDAIEKGARREELVARAKEVGVTMTKIVLGILFLAGVATTMVIAPNVFAVFAPHGRRRTFVDRSSFRVSIRSLRKRKLVEHPKGDRNVFRLTDRGVRRALTEAYRNLKITIPEQWDGIWRMILFDVSEKHKWERDEFSKKLRELGFFRMQRSVYVIPHPCREEVRFLSSLYSIEQHVRIAETRAIEHDADLREYFSV